MDSNKYYDYASYLYCNRVKSPCKSLKHAIQRAFDDLDSGETWPYQILENDEVIWEESGSVDSRRTLKELLERSKNE